MTIFLRNIVNSDEIKKYDNVTQLDKFDDNTVVMWFNDEPAVIVCDVISLESN